MKEARERTAGGPRGDGVPRSATARAATDVRTVPLDEPAFLRRITGTPGFALEVLRTLAHRLRHMDALVSPSVVRRPGAPGTGRA